LIEYNTRIEELFNNIKTKEINKKDEILGLNVNKSVEILNLILYNSIHILPDEANAVEIVVKLNFNDYNYQDYKNNIKLLEQKSILKDYIQKVKNEAAFDEQYYNFKMHLPYSLNEMGVPIQDLHNTADIGHINIGIEENKFTLSLSDQIDLDLSLEEIKKIRLVNIVDEEYCPIYNGFSSKLIRPDNFINHFKKSKGFSDKEIKFKDVKETLLKANFTLLEKKYIQKIFNDLKGGFYLPEQKLLKYDKKTSVGLSLRQHVTIDGYAIFNKKLVHFNEYALPETFSNIKFDKNFENYVGYALARNKFKPQHKINIYENIVEELKDKFTISFNMYNGEIKIF
ncbi:hypothetical protein ACFL1H_05225, partial [Nanoarchaeota archaeon]